MFWFVRNTDLLNANDFFSTSPDGQQRNQVGFTLGGPIIKNKLFLFGGYQRTWLRQIAGGGSNLTMPAAFRNGDFSSIAGKSPINDSPFQPAVRGQHHSEVAPFAGRRRICWPLRRCPALTD